MRCLSAFPCSRATFSPVAGLLTPNSLSLCHQASHTTSPTRLRVSPNGKVLWYGARGFSPVAGLPTTNSLSLCHQASHTTSPTRLRFSPNGRALWYGARGFLVRCRGEEAQFSGVCWGNTGFAVVGGCGVGSSPGPVSDSHRCEWPMVGRRRNPRPLWLSAFFPVHAAAAVA
jgi:hypothetical protein